MFANLKIENLRLTINNRILARALGTAISLLQVIISCRDWDDFICIRDQIQSQVTEMTSLLQQTAQHPR